MPSVGIFHLNAESAVHRLAGSLIITTMSVPLARSKVRVMRERELRNDLREMRSAIDKYKDYADLGYLGPQKLGTNNWPETLEILVEGVKLPGPDGKKMRFLRRVPADPFTGKIEWGMRRKRIF